MKTAQQFYDDTVQHLLTQGRPAGEIKTAPGDSPRLVCRYRTPEGLRCAAGAFIPDNVYYPDMEGAAIPTVILQHQAILRPLFPNAALARDLQRVHDDIDSWNPDLVGLSWLGKTRLHEAAIAYDLTPYEFADA